MAPQPADAPRSQHAALAAALPLLLPALQRSGSLLALHLALPHPDGPDAARQEQLWERGWQHSLPALRGLLESSTPMRHLHLTLPGCLHPATEAYRPQLDAALAGAPRAVRQQVLLALHPRAGRCSLLQLLPLAVLQKILDLAAPLKPCAIYPAYRYGGALPLPPPHQQEQEQEPQGPPPQLPQPLQQQPQVA